MWIEKGIKIMKTREFFWAGARQFQYSNNDDFEPDVVFYFFDKAIYPEIDCYKLLQKEFPKSVLFGCSTSAPLLEDDIYIGSMTGVAVKFDKTVIKATEVSCKERENSFQAGQEVARNLAGDNLKHVFVITDGMTVNGDTFAQGVNSQLPDTVCVSGGLASESVGFGETLTGVNRAPVSGNICALGFYGDHIEISTSAEGGWDKFGLERRITKSEGAFLYELDDKSALEIYKEYVGSDLSNLASHSLLFPLGLRQKDSDEVFVRTVDAIDQDTGALRFTGEVSEGHLAQFMKGDFKNLVAGAAQSAQEALKGLGGRADLALAVSCFGRQLLMGEQISDELEVVKEVLEDVPVVGFYSNGELSYSQQHKCVLHNETMTITLFRET